MITYRTGNLLEADAEVLVNTVNTVGVMGKGIALMFKQRFGDNFRRYALACQRQEVQVGSMFVTEVAELSGPRWVVNFPTKKHWRPPSQLEWIVAGLQDLRRFLVENRVTSVAIPPLGAGNGGLAWPLVREQIELALADLPEIAITVFEPSEKYQHVAKRTGVKKLAPGRAMLAEMVRQYGGQAGECRLADVHKLAWLLARALDRLGPDNPLGVSFSDRVDGPHAATLDQLLAPLDGSYLCADRPLVGAPPSLVLWFDDARADALAAYVNSELVPYRLALAHAVTMLDGFQSPFGLELLASVDRLLVSGAPMPTPAALRAAWQRLSGAAAARKRRLFDDDRLLELALAHLAKLQHTPVREPALA